jgi:hypothetical protein
MRRNFCASGLGVCAFAVAMLDISGRALAADSFFTRVRSSEQIILSLLSEGYNRSSSFRGLVDTLQHSNAIVLVQPGVCAGGLIRSCVVSVLSARGQRRVNIKVDTRTNHNMLIATIAHELQHAVEIVEHPDVTDSESTLALYRLIGNGRCRDGLSERCETTRALDTEERVLAELYQGTGGGRVSVK